MEAGRLAKLHAYVDDCLTPDERRAFEQEMAGDLRLARRAASWRGQNVAIRSAFDLEGARAFSISLVRQANDSTGRGQRPAADGQRHQREPAIRLSPPSPASASRSAPKRFRPVQVRPLSLARFGLAALALLLLCLWAPSETVGQASRLARAGIATFRTFLSSGGGPVEFAATDIELAQKWLTTRLSRPIFLPGTPAGIGLVGARIAPSLDGAAAFLVYRTDESTVGLLVQPLNSSASSAPELLQSGDRYAAVWISGGQEFCLVGDMAAASLLELAEDFFDPSGPPQDIPERGS